MTDFVNDVPPGALQTALPCSSWKMRKSTMKATVNCNRNNKSQSQNIMTDSNNEQALARAAVMECEQEIQIIKASLRKLSAAESDVPNSLEILLLKVSPYCQKFLLNLCALAILKT